MRLVFIYCKEKWPFFPDPYGYIEFTKYGDVYITSNNSGWLGGSEGILVQPVALGLGFLGLISTPLIKSLKSESVKKYIQALQINTLSYWQIYNISLAEILGY